ncbi:MAG TPA: signal recognition particle-docking protein FtsY [Verrucomicrobiales bacterium]|nr:signal recognition particle-docking protein FtsY [Verrucomicrobiales bacterium]
MFGLLQKFKDGLSKTKEKLVHEIKRIVTLSPKLSGASLEEIEMALLAADFGAAVTEQICREARKAYETQGRSGTDFLEIARREVESSLSTAEAPLARQASGLTVVSMVGVNGTGKTTTAAKLAHLTRQQGQTAMLAACDTFRAAAIEQLKLWGQRLDVPVISGDHGADAAAVAHDGVTAAQSRKVDYLFVDTAGRLHTKHNLMQELVKVHRVMDKKLPGAPHETLLVLDGSTGMNALTQAREFNKSVKLTGLVITKLDGTSKGGMVVAIHRELGLPIKFIGLGEKPDDLQPFNAKEFSTALFSE